MIIIIRGLLFKIFNNIKQYLVNYFQNIKKNDDLEN